MRGLNLIGGLEGSLIVQYVEKKPLYKDGRKVEGRQAVDKTGTELWKVTCLHTMDGERPEIVYVNVASKDEPAFEIGQALEKPRFKVTPYMRNGRIEYSLTLIR